MRFKVLLLSLCLTGLIVVWQANAASPAGGLGEPGLSFRYVETYGTVEEAYIDDSDHFNLPYGVTIDTNDNLWIAEFSGASLTVVQPQAISSKMA